MIRKMLFLGGAIVLCFPLAAFAAPIKVTTTTTVLKGFVEILGQKEVEVEAIRKPFTDPHLVRLTPSDLNLIRHSDLFVKAGGDEETWTEEAIKSADPQNLKMVDASTGIHWIYIPTETELKEKNKKGHVHGQQLSAEDFAHLSQHGHVHKNGNPYYWMDPDNVSIILDNILEGLARLRPKQVGRFVQNKENFLLKLKAKQKVWKTEARVLSGVPLISYHRSWNYFAQHFDLNIIGEVEPIPGIAPSSGHLNQLMKKMNQKNVPILLIEPYYAGKKVLKLIEAQTNVTVLILPMSIGAKYPVPDYLSLIDYNLKMLKQMAPPIIKNDD